MDIGVPKGFFKICFEGDESPEGLVGKTLLVVDFSPHGSGPFLHVGQGVGNLPVVVMVEGLVDKEIQADSVTVRGRGLIFSVVHLPPLTSDSPFTFTVLIIFFADTFRYVVW